MASAAQSMPCLQQYARLRSQLISRGSDPEAEDALAPLLHYLQTQSCCVDEVEAVQQWMDSGKHEWMRKRRIIDDMVDARKCIKQRALALSERIAVEEDRLASRVKEAGELPTYRSAPAADNGRGGSAKLVPWWGFTDGRAWEWAEVSLGMEAPPEWEDGYSFVALQDALTLVGPSLELMRYTAALGRWDRLPSLFVQGVAHVNRRHDRTDPSAIFGVLELSRLYVALSFAAPGDVAAVEKALVSLNVQDDLRRAAALLEKAGTAEGDALSTQISTDAAAALVPLRQAYWQLTASYALFFHVVMSYVEGASGGFEAFAQALLGRDGAAPLPLWGTTRFPFLRFALPDAAAEGPSRREGRTGPRAAETATVRTVLNVLFPSSTTHISATAVDYFLKEVAQLVKCVIAPAPAFSTLLLLSAVATLPLPIALAQLRRCIELRELYEGCDELVGLLAALREGRLGDAWEHAQDAARRSLRGELHFSEPVVEKLLHELKCALCFHYLRSHEAARIANAARDLRFDGPDDVLELVVLLVSQDALRAQIDLIDGTISCQDDGVSSAADATREAASRASLCLSSLEVQLLSASVERNLMVVPIDSV